MKKKKQPPPLSIDQRFFEWHRLPVPIAEYTFASPRKFRFDFAWPEQKVALEIDGGIWSRGAHGRGWGIARDQEKGNLAATLGWRVLRVQPRDLYKISTVEMVKKCLRIT